MCVFFSSFNSSSERTQIPRDKSTRHVYMKAENHQYWNAFFNNSHKTLFQCLGFLEQQKTTSLVAETVVVEKVSRSARSENNKKYTHRDLNTATERERKKNTTFGRARARKTSSRVDVLLLRAMHIRCCVAEKNSEHDDGREGRKTLCCCRWFRAHSWSIANLCFFLLRFFGERQQQNSKKLFSWSEMRE